MVSDIIRNHIFQRNLRASDHEEILYRWEATDEMFLSNRWSVVLLTKMAERLAEFACHEGNYGLRTHYVGQTKTLRRSFHFKMPGIEKGLPSEEPIGFSVLLYLGGSKFSMLIHTASM